jgi:F0F1-type ATP synthase membrane subunit b/b'
MDYMQAIEALDQMISKAKSVPLSASVVIPRDEALELVKAIRASLPQEHQQAKQVLAERDAVLAGAQQEAQKLIEQAKTERSRLVEKTEVMRSADVEAKRVVADAEAAANKLKVQADDYVDAKLANFEILLNKVLRTVHRGREQLRRRLEAAADEVPPLSLDDSGEISGPIAAPQPHEPGEAQRQG